MKYSDKQLQVIDAAKSIIRSRWSAHDITANQRIDSTEKASDFFVMHFSEDFDREVFSAAFLDGFQRLITVDDLFLGTLDGAQIHPRIIAQRVIEYRASGVIFSHNHPSGVCCPSKQDVELTTVLKKLLTMINVSLFDHIIVSGADTYSFALNGWEGVE